MTPELREFRVTRINTAIVTGRIKRLTIDPFLERDKRAWWWMQPPRGTPANYEWSHYCWQTRNQRLDRMAKHDAAQAHAKDVAKAPSGATAGWRRGVPK